jgi:hypothetical protein
MNVIDYDQIRQDDPGGTIVDALSFLMDMTVDRDRGEYLITERTVYAAIGSQSAETFLQTLEAVAQSQDPIAPVVSRVVTWLKPGSEIAGVDICNAETQGLLQAMADGGLLDQSTVDSVIELSKETVLKYPRITYGDVEKARAQA